MERRGSFSTGPEPAEIGFDPGSRRFSSGSGCAPQNAPHKTTLRSNEGLNHERYYTNAVSWSRRSGRGADPVDPRDREGERGSTSRPPWLCPRGRTSGTRAPGAKRISRPGDSSRLAQTPAPHAAGPPWQPPPSGPSPLARPPLAQAPLAGTSALLAYLPASPALRPSLGIRKWRSRDGTGHVESKALAALRTVSAAKVKLSAVGAKESSGNPPVPRPDRTSTEPV
jgi:hypothetical protein